MGITAHFRDTLNHFSEKGSSYNDLDVALLAMQTTPSRSHAHVTLESILEKSLRDGRLSDLFQSVLKLEKEPSKVTFSVLGRSTFEKLELHRVTSL